MASEIAMVIWPRGPSWHWRIEADGRVIERSRDDYVSLRAAVRDARQAHIDHMSRLYFPPEGDQGAEPPQGVARGE